MEPGGGENCQAVVFINTFQSTKSVLSQVWPLDAHLSDDFHGQAIEVRLG